MSQSWVRFPKTLRDRAKAEGRSLFCVAVDGPGGRWEMVNPMESKRAALLWLFAHEMNNGLAPLDALIAADAGLKEPFGINPSPESDR